MISIIVVLPLSLHILFAFPIHSSGSPVLHKYGQQYIGNYVKFHVLLLEC